MEKLTFKKYLESKDQLVQAISKTPVSVIEYKVHKYCSIQLNESDNINLKPNSTLIIEWKYEDVNNPTPINIKFQGIKGIENQSFVPTISGTKLTKWILKNTIGGINCAHLISSSNTNNI